MFGDAMFIWTLIISQLLCKALNINAQRHYSDYEVARMPQYDYELPPSQRPPVQPSEVVDEYHEASPAVSPPPNMDYKYIEEAPDTRKNRHISKDLDTEYTWNRPLRNPRRQQRPFESDNEQFDEEIIPKVKTNYRNPKYKAQGVNKKSRNDYTQPRKNRYTRKWDQGNRQLEELDEGIIDDDKPEIDREMINQETSKGRRRKPRDKTMMKRDDNDYGAAENEFRKQMQKIREQTMFGEPPGLVPGPKPAYKNEIQLPEYARNQNVQPIPRPSIPDEGGGKDFDYYDMKRLKKERDRARKLEKAFGRRAGGRVRWRPGSSFAPYLPIESEEPSPTPEEETESTWTISWAPVYTATSIAATTHLPTLTPSKTTKYLHTRTRLTRVYSTKSTTEDKQTTTEPTPYTIVVSMSNGDTTPTVETATASETLITTSDNDKIWTTDSDEAETTSELTVNQALLRRKAMKDLSLAEKSRLSILKKAERKDGIKFMMSQKPPVLLQVTPNMATVVMVEPPPDKNNPANMAAVMRVKEVSDDTPEKLEMVKSLMRKKLIAGARNFDDLTKDWDSLVCDYIDTDVLEKAMSGANVKQAKLINIFMVLAMCYIISLTG